MCVCVGESSAGSSLTDPSLLAVFYDYIKLMPMMAEANQMSQELNKVTLRFLKYHIFFVFVASCVHSYLLTSALCCLPCFQGVEFKLEIKNLALSDSKGHDLKKELVVRVTAKGRKQVDPSSSLSFTQSSSYTSVQFQSRSEFLSLCSNSILRFGFGPRPSLWTANSWWKMSTSSTRLKRAEEM